MTSLNEKVEELSVRHVREGITLGRHVRRSPISGGTLP